MRNKPRWTTTPTTTPTMTENEPQPDPKAPYTKLSTKVKRGTGTRDQDTTKVVTRHPEPDEAVANHFEALSSVRKVAEQVRTVQPERRAEDEE